MFAFLLNGRPPVSALEPVSAVHAKRGRVMGSFLDDRDTNCCSMRVAFDEC